MHTARFSESRGGGGLPNSRDADPPWGRPHTYGQTPCRHIPVEADLPVGRPPSPCEQNDRYFWKYYFVRRP